MTLNIGIKEEKKQEIALSLSKLLADTYTLYLKTHKYHWNITGPNFQSLHLMLEQHYGDLALAVDELAERIRVLGVKAPGSYTEFAKLSTVKDDPSLNSTAKEMIQTLLSDHEQVVNTAKTILPLLEDSNDEGTNSLLGARIEYHEKIAWMLKSSC